MRRSHPRSFRSQATFLRRQFLQDGGLPFTDVLTEELIAHALNLHLFGRLDYSMHSEVPYTVVGRRALPDFTAGTGTI